MSDIIPEELIVTPGTLSRALRRLPITIKDPEGSASVRGSEDGWQPVSAKGLPRDPDDVALEMFKLIEIAQYHRDACTPPAPRACCGTYPDGPHLGACKYGDDRFPITRGHLTTRLSLALEHTPILIKGNHLKPVEGRDDDYFTVLPHAPGPLAEELVADIECQGASQSVVRQQYPPSEPEQIDDRPGPDYYKGDGGMQPFDVIDAFGLDFYEGNVVKYVCRWRNKNGLEDLYKARRYINEVIKRAEAVDRG